MPGRAGGHPLLERKPRDGRETAGLRDLLNAASPPVSSHRGLFVARQSPQACYNNTPPTLPPPPTTEPKSNNYSLWTGARRPKSSANAFADSLDWRPFDARASVPMAAALEELGQSVTAASGRTGSRICKGLPLKASAALGRIRVGSRGEGRGVSLRRGGGRGARRKINSFPVISLVQTGRVERCRGSVEQSDGRTTCTHTPVKRTHGAPQSTKPPRFRYF